MTTKIQVRYIPDPGLWKRAPLITPDGRRATAVHIQPPTRAWVDEGGVGYGVVRSVTDDWYLCLDDALGLGLAGLAATVALRLGWGAHLMGPYRLSDTLHDMPWMPVHGPSGQSVELGSRGLPRDRNAIVEASTYLALIDRLCKAVGLEREGNEVAVWRIDPSPDGDEWTLWLGGEALRFSNISVALPWQPTLEAALAEVAS